MPQMPSTRMRPHSTSPARHATARARRYRGFAHCAFILLGMLAAASPGRAAPPQVVEHAGVVRAMRGVAWRLPPGEALAARVVDFLAERRAAWRLPSDVTWQVLGVTSRAHRHVVRLRAAVAGIPVAPGEVRVVVDDRGRVRAVSGLPPPTTGSPTPDVDPARAAAVARKRFAGGAAANATVTTAGRARLVWLDRGARARLAWQVRLRIAAARLVAPVVYVDAHNGEILWLHDTVLH